jgi:hypothetical protein
MTISYAKKIGARLKDHLTSDASGRIKEYQCEESMEYGDYKIKCKANHARSFYVDEIIDKENDTITIRLKPYLKSPTGNPLEILCDTKAGSRNKCTVGYTKPTSVYKVKPRGPEYWDKKIGPDIYHTEYEWRDTETWFMKNRKEFFQVSVQVEKGGLAHISIGNVPNPDYDWTL